MQKSFLGFFLLLFASTSLVVAQSAENPAVIDLNKLQEVNHLKQNKVVFIEDKTSSMRVEEVQKAFEAQKGKTVPDPYQINFGQSSATFWLCFQVKDTLLEELGKKWVLKIAYPSLDSVDLYFYDKNGYLQACNTGDKKGFSERDIKSTRFFAFHLPIHNQEAHTFYLRIRGDGVLSVPIIFYELEHYYTQAVYEETLMGAFYGIILVLSFYNLFLYFVLRSRMYLMYVAYMLGIAFFSASLDGHLFQYVFFWSVSLAESALVLSGYSAFFFLVSFIQAFLKTDKNIRNAHLVLNVLKYFFVLMSGIYLITGNYKIPVGILALASPTTALTVFLVCGYAAYKKVPSANLLIFAFLSSLLGTFIYGLKNANVLPNSMFTAYSYYVGFTIQGIIFSLALAERYKQLKRELINTQKEANETLELKVKERTEALEKLHQEMVSQNEELQQSQEEILAQRDAIAIKSNELAQMNSQMRSSIKAAKVIQKAILPYPEKRAQLLKNYFVINKPKDVVSGDFYWLNQIENTTFLAVADCTGHGVPGAFMTLIANNLLDKIIRMWGIKSPAAILERLHDEIEIVLRQKETENNYGMDASIIALIPQEDNSIKLTFAGAKQNLYFKEQVQASIQVLRGNRRSIGGSYNASASFEDKHLMLQPNDRIYMTSDGFIDQNNVERRKVLEMGFVALLEQMQNLPMNEQKHFLQRQLQVHMKDTVQRDDILVVGLQL